MGRFFLETVMGAADDYNMMFRAGDFCVSPYCRQIRGEKVARIRLSFYLYNTEEESRLAVEMFRMILDKRA
jgi:selenocysteine lyase/cysteine desulfurase